MAAELARHLDPWRFEVHLCVITEDRYGAPLIPRWVQVHRFRRKRVRSAWFQIIWLIRSERPDVVLSGMAHLNFLVLLLRPFLHFHLRILVRQNATASATSPSLLTRLLYRHLYPRAHAVICQSQAMADDSITASRKLA